MSGAARLRAGPASHGVDLPAGRRAGGAGPGLGKQTLRLRPRDTTSTLRGAPSSGAGASWVRRQSNDGPAEYFHTRCRVVAMARHDDCWSKAGAHARLKGRLQEERVCVVMRAGCAWGCHGRAFGNEPTRENGTAFRQLSCLVQSTGPIPSCKRMPTAKR